jgi:diguanylate cyclase (GGDEF)-like protein
VTAPTDSEQGPTTELSHQPRGWSWSRFAAVLALVASGVVILSTRSWAPAGLGRLPEFLAIIALIAVGNSYPLRVPRDNDGSESFFLDEAFLVYALLVLPAEGAFAAAVLGSVIGELIRRVAPGKTVVNISTQVMGAAAAVGVFYLIAPSGAGIPWTALAGACAVVSYVVTCRLTISTAFYLINNLKYRETLLDNLRFQLLGLAGGVSLGLVAGLASKIAWWAPGLSVLPLALMYLVLGEHLRAKADRARLTDLLDAAMAAHATIETDEVLRALEKSARTLVRCRRAWTATRPPSTGEVGVLLGHREDRDLWLVVADRIGNEPFGEADEQVLQGVAAIAGSALDNADLVDQIRHQGLHDQLTGLSNQLLFDDRARQAVQRAQRDRESVAVLAIDLDGFKKVNESFGHETGNEVLLEAGRRLAESVREIDTLARMSGDHFNVLLPGAGSPDTVGVTADRLLEVLRRPFPCDTQEAFLTASVGIAIGPLHGLTASELLRNADSAMHQAKAEGGDAKRFYSPDMNEQALARLSRESELHAALRNQELYLLYQPQINLRSGAMVGVEALVRWRHPILGIIPPDDFIPIAEESGLIGELDSWVLRSALAQLRTWDEAGLPPLHMAVNQSGRNFNDDRIVDQVVAALERTGIEPSRLEIEITERVALRGSPETSAILEKLRRIGARLAVDDFGTGYSSLAQLQQFTVDRLKIDRGFIRQVTSAHGPAPLIAAFIGIARALNMEVIAEGVETAEQEAFLRRYDCDEAQGYLYSKPVLPDEVAYLLTRKSSLLVTQG